MASPNNASPAADETAAFAERWAPGQVLVGKYVVEHVVGAGAMAIVVSALHKQLDTRVAIKFLRPEMLSKSDLVSRFRREGRAAAKIRSKHVARVFDVGELEDGTPFIVMEYLEGHNLAQVLEERGPMPVGETIGYALQVCEALAGAHALGIVHRDIKPANIFLHSDGEVDCVKLLDFGISKAVPGAAGGNDLSLTQTVSLMGSPLYMSPEQLRETRIADARSDIWALGVVVYELLTGEVAFNAESITKLTATILEGSPKPICAFRPDVPAELESVIHRCLAKDMALRYQAVTDLARDLMPFASEDARGAAERSPLLRSPTGVPLPPGSAPSRSPPPPASGQVSKGGGVVVGSSFESASRISLSPTLPSSAATPARSTFSRSVPAGDVAEEGEGGEGREGRPEPVLASKASAAPRGRFLALGLGALVVLGGGYTVWSLRQQSTTARPTPAPDASAPVAASGAPGGAVPPSNVVGAPVASAPSGVMGAPIGGSPPAPSASGSALRVRLTVPPKGARPPGRPPTAQSQRPPSASPPNEGEPDIGY